jgi:two-component system, cell cycle sensor histidine kinase and response regulator CckA
MSGTILIVDDESAQRDLMRRVLSLEGYAILEAADIQEALEVQQGHPGEIRLLLADLILPDGNAYRLAGSLREREPRLKVLFVSGQTGAELRKFFDAPFSDLHFLQKPFSSQELSLRVKAVLESGDPFANSVWAS